MRAIPTLPTAVAHLIVEYESSAFFDETRPITQIRGMIHDAVFVDVLRQWIFTAETTQSFSSVYTTDSCFGQNIQDKGSCTSTEIESVSVLDDLVQVNLNPREMFWFLAPTSRNGSSLAKVDKQKVTCEKGGAAAVWIDGCPLDHSRTSFGSRIRCRAKLDGDFFMAPISDIHLGWSRHFYLPDGQEALVMSRPRGLVMYLLI